MLITHSEVHDVMNHRSVGRAVLSFAGVFSLVAFVAVLCLPVTVSAEKAGIGWTESIAAKKGKAKSIADLAAMYDSASCVACHKEVADQWGTTSHSMSILGTKGRTADAFWAAVQDGLMKWQFSGVKNPATDVKVEHLMICAKCHLPQLADAEDSVALEIVATLSDRQGALDRKDAASADKASAKLASINIGCLVCHNRNAIVHKWTDGYPKAGEIYGRKDGAHQSKDYPTTRKSPILGESIMCGQCHGQGPTIDQANPTQCTTLYGSYLYAYKSHGGKEECQDCHMRAGKIGHATKARSTPELLKKAIEVTTKTHGFFWRADRQYVPRVLVDVTMVNKAGHSIPDGISSSHRILLEVTAKDEDGGKIFSATRTYMQVPQRFGRGGKMGRAAFEKTGIIEDTALLPDIPVQERFDILLEPKADAVGGAKAKKLFSELTVDVVIRQVTGDEGVGGGESVEMYKTSRTVTIEEGR